MLKMLPRILILLVVIGFVAGAADRTYDNRGSYDPPYGSRDTQYGSNYDSRNPNRNDPYNTQQYNGQYDQNRNMNFDRNAERYPTDYNMQSGYNRNNKPNGNYIYAKNQTAIFCYVNGTRIQQGLSQPSIDGFVHEGKLDIHACTHLLLGAAIIHPSRPEVHTIDPNFLTEDYKGQNRDLKILVSISGDARVWANMAEDPSRRQQFANSVKAFATGHSLDGVNIDWQWPVGGGGMGNHKNAYKELLTTVKRTYREGLLTTFIAPEEMQISELFQQYINEDTVDFYILMALELRGHNFQKIEHHAPVDSYVSGQTVRKAIYSIRRYVPEHTLYQWALAIPFYGKRYQLDSRNLNRDESPIDKPFMRQHSVYRESMTHSYAQICRELTANKYHYGYDHTNEAAYAVHEATVYVYENAESVTAKTRLALQNGFGGVMAYSIDMDDTIGNCQNPNRQSTNDRYYHSSSSSDNRSPLLQAMYTQVQRGNAAMFHSSPLAIAFAVLCAMILRVNN